MNELGRSPATQHQPMNYYRADKRTLSIGERIGTANEYYDKFEGLAKSIEDALEEARPDHLIPRTRCLFVFEDLNAAKKHWSKMAGGKLYRVHVDPADISHRADMAMMDSMKELATVGADWKPLVLAYWSGQTTANPEIEVMVRAAIVQEVLSDSESDRRAYYRKRVGLP